MEVDFNEYLEVFIKEKKRFPKVTNLQKKKWIENIKNQVIESLEDNDIFYDNIPEDVKEVNIEMR